MMNKKFAAAAALVLCPTLFLSSCVYRAPMFGSASVGYYDGGVGVGVSAAWTPASYDAEGFPIYGYSYGRPVYGYTAEGLAIFSFAALTAACLVPLWAPAPWYHGHWCYPHGIHRVNCPPKFPHDHIPAKRPSGGLNAPIHKKPHEVLHKQPKPSAKQPLFDNNGNRNLQPLHKEVNNKNKQPMFHDNMQQLNKNMPNKSMQQLSPDRNVNQFNKVSKQPSFHPQPISRPNFSSSAAPVKQQSSFSAPRSAPVSAVSGSHRASGMNSGMQRISSSSGHAHSNHRR